MLPANLTPLEVLDLGIHSETLAFRMYDALAKRVHVPRLQIRLSQLKKDEKEHRKTLRAHRRELFPDAEVTISEDEARRIFGGVDPKAIRDRESLIQVLYGAIRFEEYAAYFYEKIQYKMPNREARIFMEVLADEGRTHAEILKQQVDSLRSIAVTVDEKGRAVEAY
ncbi:MAG: ferritin family protein [Planctomycetota bacterium]